MTRKFAISETKKLWTEIKESRLSKLDFLKTTKQGQVWCKKKYHFDCPLCEYVKVKIYPEADITEDCCECPLVKKYRKQCFTLGYTDNYFSKEFYEKVMEL